MSLLSASQLLSEAMIVGEHPGEPMVILGISRLNDDFPYEKYSSERLLALTEDFFQQNPRLTGRFDLKENGTPLKLNSDYKSLAKAAWGQQTLDEESFKRQTIDPSGSCLIRFKLDKESGLMVAVHHGLLDGRGLYKLQYDFLKFLIDPSVKLSDEASYEKKRRRNFFLEIISYISFSVSKVKELLYPPLILGGKEVFAGDDVIFYTHQYDIEKIKRVLKIVRKRNTQATLNDILLSSLQLTVFRKFNSESQFSRQAIMMPIDLRRHGKFPSFENLSSGVNINSYQNDFISIEKLLDSVVKNSRKSIAFNFDIYTLNFLKRIKKIGILNESRQFLLNKGLPRRCFKGGKNFWRFSSTLIFANMGTLRLEKSIRDVLTEISAFPAIISPTSLAITAFIFKDLQLNFRCSTAVFSQKSIMEFARTIETSLDEIEEAFEEEV